MRFLTASKGNYMDEWNRNDVYSESIMPYTCTKIYIEGNNARINIGSTFFLSIKTRGLSGASLYIIYHF
jgi:hypothetical protein